MMIRKRIEIINSRLKIKSAERPGVALLVVLFIVMTITILSLGFLSHSDVELACGKNMVLRSEMDYLAESGLIHAKGLILHPQEIGLEYWTGDIGQQLVAGSDDYYDVKVVRDDSVPTNRCNYVIDCNSYRLKNGEKIGRSSIKAELRLDNCIAYWVGSSTIISQQVTINGDVYCNGSLVNNGVINGDVFASGSITGASIKGQKNVSVTQAPMDWPPLEVSDFSSTYYIGSTSYSVDFIGFSVHPSGSFNPSTGNPAGVRYLNGNLELPGNVDIEGMLVVDGTLRISGVNNTVTAVKNFPALLVSGDVIIEGNGRLEVNGLAVVNGQIQISADNASVDILGGLFVEGGIMETTADASDNDNTGVLQNGPIWSPFEGKVNGSLEFDGINDHVKVPDDQSFDITNEITVTAWVNPVDTYVWRTIVSKFAHTPAWRKDLYWFLYDGKIGASLAGPCGIGGTDWKPDVPIQTGVWTHVALTYDGSTMKMYKDGFNVATTNVSGNLLLADGFSNESFYIGKNTEWGEYFYGLIDDVRIYNHALDANDIYPPVDGLAGLVGYWKLDEAGSSVTITAAPCKTAIMVWPSAGVAEKWEQTSGAFFRSIERKCN